MTDAQHINQNSSCVEYYTPPFIIEAARRTMGQIDLDPASSLKANESVKAGAIFDYSDDALRKTWFGKVFMNHPFGRREPPCSAYCKRRHAHHPFALYGNAAWVNRLAAEFLLGRVTQACCITYACTSEKWFQPLLRRPQCFLVPRTNYILPDGRTLKGITKGSVVTYFGQDHTQFVKEFIGLGVCKVAA